MFRVKRLQLSYQRAIALGFVLLILLGTLLLMLPISSVDRVWTDPLSALFTATSAVCVTGLVVVDTATYWSLFGQLVLLLLIQTGGLGLMTVATLFSLAMRRRIGLAERSLVQESEASVAIGGVVGLTRRILLGTFVPSSGYYDAYYKKALQVKAAIKAAFDRAFHQCDLLLTPVAPTTAPKLGENLGDPLNMYLSDIYTVSVNLAGLPGLSMPCAFDSKGMPIGAQLIGPQFGEGKVLNTAHALQMDTDYHRRSPYGKEAV